MSDSKKKKKSRRPRRARGEDGKFVKKVEDVVDASKPEQVMVAVPPDAADAYTSGAVDNDDGTSRGPPASREIAEQFPTSKLSAAEEKDQLMLMRAALGEQFGRQTFKDEDAYWLLRKMEAAKEADFQAWFARYYDRADDVHKKWVRATFPRFLEERLATLDENLHTLRALARLKIKGVETPQDLALKYAADQGMLPMEMLRDVLHPESQFQGADNAATFQRGLFNLDRFYFDDATVGDHQTQRNIAFGNRGTVGDMPFGQSIAGAGVNRGFPAIPMMRGLVPPPLTAAGAAATRDPRTTR